MANSTLTFIVPGAPTRPAVADAEGDAKVAAPTTTPPATEPAPYALQHVVDSTRFGGAAQDRPVAFTIPSTEPGLSRALRRELLSAYVVHGVKGVEQFAASVFGQDEYSDFLMRDGQQAKRFWGPKEGDEAVEQMRPAVSPERAPLWKAFEIERVAMLAEIKRCAESLQKAATEVAAQRVATCRALLVAEAERYLSLKGIPVKGLLSGGAEAASAVASRGPGGPEGADLVRVLQQLQPLLNRVRQEGRDLMAARGLSAAAQPTTALTSLMTALQPLASVFAVNLHTVPGAAAALAPDRPTAG